MSKVLIDRELLERAAMMELDTTKRTIAIQDELRAILAAQLQPAEADARVPKGKVLIDVAVVEFLNGSGELNGMHFGDHISGRPQFWWRHYLPAADAHPDDTLAAPRQPEGEIKPDITTKHGYPAYSVEQHQRAIAERDATIERLEAGIPRLQEHAHQMRQQRDRLRAENERLRKSCAGVIARSVHETRAATNSALDGYLAAGIAATDAELDTLRQQLAEANDDTSRWHEIACKQSKRADGLADQRDKLAGLLREAGGWIDRTSFHGTDAVDLMQRIDAALAEANKP